MREIIIDFAKYSSIRIGGSVPVNVLEIDDVGASFANSTLHFKHVLESSKASCINLESLESKALLDSKDLYVIGSANNLLVSPNAKNLAMLGATFSYINICDEFVEMGASVSAQKAFLFFKKNDLQGLEFLKNLPGQIGALCNMNAGMKNEEMKNILQEININGQWVSAKNAGLVYRGRSSGGVIFAARFHKIRGFKTELLKTFKAMRSTHPKEPSCGSCFKNPQGDYAGRLLEEAKMKGFFINNVGFSQRHANFLVNKSCIKDSKNLAKNIVKPSFEDAINVINIARKKVWEKSGIWLECEVKICE